MKLTIIIAILAVYTVGAAKEIKTVVPIERPQLNQEKESNIMDAVGHPTGFDYDFGSHRSPLLSIRRQGNQHIHIQRMRRTNEKIAFGKYEIDLNKEYLGIDLLYWIIAGSVSFALILLLLCCFCRCFCFCRGRKTIIDNKSSGSNNDIQDKQNLPTSSSHKDDNPSASKIEIESGHPGDVISAPKQSFAFWASPSDKKDVACVY